MVLPRNCNILEESSLVSGEKVRARITKQRTVAQSMVKTRDRVTTDDCYESGNIPVRLNTIPLAQKLVETKINSEDCSQVTIISQSDIPYVIQLPGKYELCGDVTYTPDGSDPSSGPFGYGAATAAITIMSENVTLNLKSFTITQGNYVITNVTSDGTNITFTANNNFVAGATTINITGIVSNPVDVYNQYNVVISSATSSSFTISSSAVGIYQSGGIAALSDIYGVLIGFGPFGYGYSNYNQDYLQTNLTVTNGNIVGFSGVGVLSFNNTFGDGNGNPATLSQPFTDMRFSKLNILNCGVADSPNYFGNGINLDSQADDFFPGDPTVTESYQNIIIDSCNVNNCLGQGAINVLTFDNLVIKDCQANNLFLNHPYRGLHPNSVPYPYSINLVGLNLQMNNTQANGFTCMSNISTFSGALSIQNSSNIQVSNCQFNNSFVYAGTSVSDVEINDNMVFENCQFNNVGGGPSTTIVNGCHGSSGRLKSRTGTGTKWINCQFNHPYISEDALNVNLVCGYFFTCEGNMIFENCQACNIDVQLLNFSSVSCIGGFVIGADEDDSPKGKSDVYNITFHNCVASDIHSNANVVAGFFAYGSNGSYLGQQPLLSNVIFDSCVSQRISTSSFTASCFGIGAGYFSSANAFYAALSNVQILNSSVSDVHGPLDVNGNPNPVSAGILAQSIQRPILKNNTVGDCDRGFLLTGTDEYIPNGFQFAATLTDALSLPPVAIDLTPTFAVTTNIPGLGPFPAALAAYSPPFVLTSGPGVIVTPRLACSSVSFTPPGSGNIGVSYRGNCNFTTKTVNIEASGSVGTIVIDNVNEPLFTMQGQGTVGAYPSVLISKSDGALLAAALAPRGVVSNIILSIISVPPVSSIYTVVNQTRGNSITFTPANVTKGTNLVINPQFDLKSLGWKSGDTLIYQCSPGGVAVPGLTCGDTYYAILYPPGFSQKGMIQGNSASNCITSGFQDDLTPCTSSAWLSNTGFCNKSNFDIHWGGKPPVAKGTLTCYPQPKTYIENVSILCGKCDCRKDKRKHC
jgi:hypothetical protein